MQLKHWIDRLRGGPEESAHALSPISARVAAGVQFTQAALEVHWWHYRYLFLEAKRAALYERLHPGEEDAGGSP